MKGSNHMTPFTISAGALIAAGFGMLVGSGASFESPGEPFLGLMQGATGGWPIPPALGALVFVGGIAMLLVKPKGSRGE